MALNAAQIQRIRNWLETKATAITWRKAAVNDAVAAIDTFFAANVSTLSTAINSASTPHGVTFTATQKKMMVALYCLAKFDQDKDG